MTEIIKQNPNSSLQNEATNLIEKDQEALMKELGTKEKILEISDKLRMILTNIKKYKKDKQKISELIDLLDETHETINVLLNQVKSGKIESDMTDPYYMWLHKKKSLNGMVKMLLEMNQGGSFADDEFDDIIDIGLQDLEVSLETFMEKLNLSEILDEIMKHEVHIQNSGIKFEYNLKENNIFTDKNHLTLIITNVLTNSLKFTPKENGKIIISSQKAHKEGFVEIIIADNGIGIPKDNQDKVFSYSYTTTGLQGEQGTGFGLGHNKKLIENYGGTIWLESEGKDRGTSVHFTLPTFK